jgi:hypothetical protein
MCRVRHIKPSVDLRSHVLIAQSRPDASYMYEGMMNIACANRRARVTDKFNGVAPEYQIPDELWERIRPLLPEPKPNR